MTEKAATSEDLAACSRLQKLAAAYSSRWNAASHVGSMMYSESSPETIKIMHLN